MGNRQNQKNWFHVGMLALYGIVSFVRLRQAMKTFGAIGSNQPIGAAAFGVHGVSRCHQSDEGHVWTDKK